MIQRVAARIAVVDRASAALRRLAFVMDDFWLDGFRRTLGRRTMPWGVR